MPRVAHSGGLLPILQVLLVVTCDAVVAQGPPPVELEPLGDEAYGVVQQFFEYDHEVPLAARVVERVETRDHIREKVVLDGLMYDRVPGYLGIPATGTPPYPVVLQLHGLGGSKSDWWDDGNNLSRTTRGLLSAGFAVLALDAQFHGERLAWNDYEPPWSMIERGENTRYLNLMVRSTIEYRRAIDYLSTRADIDADRIGVVGYSMGGHMTFMLTGVEPRIRVAIACVPPSMGRAIAPHQFARAVDDRPFLMLMGSKDPYHPVNRARQLHELVNSRTKALTVYDSGHSLPPEHVARVVEWFQARLN